MRRVSRSALVPYSAEQMFALVDDIERYPDFLPWCSSTEEHSRDQEQVEASIELRKAGVRHRFRTRNVNQPGRSIELNLVDGPFRTLHGVWKFDAVAEGSRVSLDIEFEFQSRLTDRLLGPFFEEICNKLVNSFIQRADVTYGE